MTNYEKFTTNMAVIGIIGAIGSLFGWVAMGFSTILVVSFILGYECNKRYK